MIDMQSLQVGDMVGVVRLVCGLIPFPEGIHFVERIEGRRVFIRGANAERARLFTRPRKTTVSIAGYEEPVELYSIEEYEALVKQVGEQK